MRAVGDDAGRDGRGGVLLFRGVVGAAVASLYIPAWHPTAAVSTGGKLAGAAGGGVAAGGAASRAAAERTGGGGAAASWPWTEQQAAC